jgi:hypothetical protein
MNERFLKIDGELNKVHTVLTKIISKNQPVTLTQKEFTEVEDAEELLDKIRTRLLNLPEAK